MMVDGVLCHLLTCEVRGLTVPGGLNFEGVQSR